MKALFFSIAVCLTMFTFSSSEVKAQTTTTLTYTVNGGIKSVSSRVVDGETITTIKCNDEQDKICYTRIVENTQSGEQRGSLTTPEQVLINNGILLYESISHPSGLHEYNALWIEN